MLKPKFSSFIVLSFVMVFLVLTGCASSGAKRFDRITPGMNTEEVKDTMDEGPSRFETSNADQGYASWYWGDDYCVLFKNDRVVAKDSSSEGTSGSASGVEYQEKRKARCLSPGQKAQSNKERTVHIPGVGTMHLPSGG